MEKIMEQTIRQNAKLQKAVLSGLLIIDEPLPSTVVCGSTVHAPQFFFIEDQ
jgi:hypothetical protein